MQFTTKCHMKTLIKDSPDHAIELQIGSNTNTMNHSSVRAALYDSKERAVQNESISESRLDLSKLVTRAGWGNGTRQGRVAGRLKSAGKVLQTSPPSWYCKGRDALSKRGGEFNSKLVNSCARALCILLMPDLLCLSHFTPCLCTCALTSPC